jgi:polysaccharide biosynthesis/export protein
MSISTTQNQKVWILILVFQLAFWASVFAQSATGQRNTARTSSSVDGIYYVDEVAIRLASDQFPIEGFIDENTYVLGSMDMLSIEIRGSIPVTYRSLLVNSEGYLIIPNIGSVKVGEVLLVDAKELIKNRVSQRFSSSDIEVTLEKPKAINVHITGDVLTPGRYRHAANTRLESVLIPILVGYESGIVNTASGAAPPVLKRFRVSSRPINIGFDAGGEYVDLSIYALRNVHIRHRDGTSSNSDLLGYFNSGLIEANPFLRDGDVITIRKKNHQTPTVSVSGGVNAQFVGDYRDDDLLGQVFSVAGGYALNADTTHVVIVRLVDGSFTALTLQGSIMDNATFRILPNDRVIIPILENQAKTGSVWISGEISKPGNYPILSGTTKLREVLELSGMPTSQALLNGAFISRSSGNDFVSSLNIELIQRSSDQFIENIEFLRNEFALGGTNLFIDLSDESQLNEVRLHDGDRLYIPRNDNTVLVMGQVNRTGYVPVISGRNVDAYIDLAGGLTIAADPSRIFVLKAGTRSWYKAVDTRVEPGDIVYIDRVPFDEFTQKRSYDLQVKQSNNSNYQLILSGIATVASIITTYLVLTTK